MKKRRLLFIALLTIFTSVSFAGMPNEYESMAIQMMKLIEKTLAPLLPDKYYIVKTHSSSVGEVLNNQFYIRDCLIEEKISNGIGRAYLAVYPKNSNFDKQFNNELLGDIEVSREEIVIKIALFSENDELIELITNAIRNIDFSDLKPIDI